MSGSPVVQLRVPPELLSAVDSARGEESRSGWILAAIELALSAEGEPTAPPVPVAVPAALSGLTAGEPSPGVVCMGPSCWERDTARYGLRRLPLCHACAAALGGEVYQRPEAARARGLKRPAA